MAREDHAGVAVEAALEEGVLWVQNVQQRLGVDLHARRHHVRVEARGYCRQEPVHTRPLVHHALLPVEHGQVEALQALAAAAAAPAAPPFLRIFELSPSEGNVLWIRHSSMSSTTVSFFGAASSAPCDAQRRGGGGGGGAISSRRRACRSMSPAERRIIAGGFLVSCSFRLGRPLVSHHDRLHRYQMKNHSPGNHKLESSTRVSINHQNS